MIFFTIIWIIKYKGIVQYFIAYKQFLLELISDANASNNHILSPHTFSHRTINNNNILSNRNTNRLQNDLNINNNINPV